MSKHTTTSHFWHSLLKDKIPIDLVAGKRKVHKVLLSTICVSLYMCVYACLYNCTYYTCVCVYTFCVCVCALPGPRFVQIMGFHPPVKQNSIIVCTSEKCKVMQIYLHTHTHNTKAEHCRCHWMGENTITYCRLVTFKAG